MERKIMVNGVLYTTRNDAIAAVVAIIENSPYYRRRANADIIGFSKRHAVAIIDAAIKYGNSRQKGVIVTTAK